MERVNYSTEIFIKISRDLTQGQFCVAKRAAYACRFMRRGRSADTALIIELTRAGVQRRTSGTSLRHLIN